MQGRKMMELSNGSALVSAASLGATLPPRSLEAVGCIGRDGS